MMDLQKEREAFLKWHYQAYLLENPEIDVKNAQYIYDYAHKNALCAQLRESHFLIWQAAKAQAIPDGFVVVPVEPKQETIKQMNKVWFESNCAHIMKTKTAELLYKAMIEAQEQAND